MSGEITLLTVRVQGEHSGRARARVLGGAPEVPGYTELDAAVRALLAALPRDSRAMRIEAALGPAPVDGRGSSTSMPRRPRKRASP